MSTKDKTQQADGKKKSSCSPTEGHKIIQTKVFGTVQWFNFNNGYGFIQRSDTEEDIFVHHSAFKSNNVHKYLSSVGEGGTVQFDIVEGKKGQQAANVTVTVQTDLKTMKDVSKAHLDELSQLREEQTRLTKELQEVKDDFEKDKKSLNKGYEKALRYTDAVYSRKMEAQKAQSAKELNDQEDRFQKQLEAQEASWKKEKEPKTRNSWFFIFGGVCVAVGFLSAKYLTK